MQSTTVQKVKVRPGCQDCAPSQLPLFNSSSLRLKRAHTASSFCPSTPVNPLVSVKMVVMYNIMGRQVGSHYVCAPPDMTPEFRIYRRLTKNIDSSPSVSSAPSSPVLATPQAVVPRRSLALLLPSTLHPRTRPTSSSTSPLLFCHLGQKEQGFRSVTQVIASQTTRSYTTFQSTC